MEKEKMNSFEVLSKIDLGNKVKEKIGFKYLSWADAWKILKSNYPDAEYIIYNRIVKTTETKVEKEGGYEKTVVIETANEIPYFTDGKTCFVKVGVKIDDVEYIEQYPIMDHKNIAIPTASVTMTAVNKSLQRAFVKACARHGLGLYIYAGEDLPDGDKEQIDFDGIYNQAINAKLSPIDENKFEELRKTVISKIQEGRYTNAEITDTVAKLLKGKRLSALEYNSDCGIIQTVDIYLSLIDAATSINTNGR